MTHLRLCQPIPPRQHQPDAFERPKEAHTMPRNYYVAELLGVWPEPLPRALAEELAAELAIGVDEICACRIPDSKGAGNWGVFRVHMIARNKARAEIAALGLAQELGDDARACILGDWAESRQGLAGGAQ